jgi:adenylosuccinate lyase
MELTSLTALSPLDGRYHEKMKKLRSIFSEFGLIKFRVTVEISWLTMLSQSLHHDKLSSLSLDAQDFLQNIINNFSIENAEKIKLIEKEIKHDVKAVEYFIKEQIAVHSELAQISEWIHFGCTSEDINNLAYGLMLKAAREECLYPALNEIIILLKNFAHEYAHLPMLARTHGQPATPTTLGKEIANTIARLQRQMTQLHQTEILGKLNGATGNYNALAIVYPEINWEQISEDFITQLGLTFNPYTTQIEPHDSMAEYFGILTRINHILIDFNRDVWSYIAINYFKQQSNANEVGSSTMPHKINPIDFENAEGNLGIANALFEHMIAKLPISRWQRDLSDSTVLRNIGVAIGHSLLAYQSSCLGLKKLAPNTEMIEQDLNNHYEILAEAIQTMMRRYHLDQPYEQLKAFTRGKTINKTLLQDFIRTLPLPSDAKKQLLSLEPKDYIGYAGDLAEKV